MLKNRTMPMDPYFQKFSENGHNAEFIPLLNHAPVSIEETTKYLAGEHFLNSVDRFIITSQRAVEVFHECLKEITENDPGAASKIRSKIGYTVGPATEQILKENGFSDVRGGSHAGNGSLLADIVIRELPDLAHHVVFFTGVIRKNIIPVKLTKHGVTVEEVVIYKTEPKDGIEESFLSNCQEKLDWVVFFSPQGTESIVGHCQNLKVKIASIGPTTQEYLEENGITAHVVAPKPTAASLYNSLIEWSD